MAIIPPPKEKLKQKYYPLSDIRKSRRDQSQVLMRMGLISAAAQKYSFSSLEFNKERCIVSVFSHLYSTSILQPSEIPKSVMYSSFLAKLA